MHWINSVFFTAIRNSHKKAIQRQFLWIFFTIGLLWIGYQWYVNIISIEMFIAGIVGTVLVSILLYQFPKVLWPLLFVWLLFGLLMGELTSTVILGFIFYILFFPITFILRITRRKKEIQKPQWFFRENDSIDYERLY